MAGVFFAFALADSVIIKAVGIGIGIAVVLDATIVRTLLVPATMRLMGRWNWWAPGWVVGARRRLRGRSEYSRARPSPRRGEGRREG
jgi:RND superfamily putative drug exporter